MNELPSSWKKFSECCIGKAFYEKAKLNYTKKMYLKNNENERCSS